MNELVSALKTVQESTEALEALKAGVLEKESPPQVFLDYAEGDYTAAAQRLSYYWKERMSVFGADYLKPLQECLTDQHKKWLAMDVAYVLPGTNKEGHRVLLASSYHGREALALCRFVSLHNLMIEQHQQSDRKGITLLRVQDPTAPFDRKWAQSSQHVLLNAFPVEVHRIRIVCAGRKEHIKKTLMPMLYNGMGKDLSRQCITNVDTDLSRMQGHLSDMLEAHQLPVWLGGTWKRQDETKHEASSSNIDEDVLASVVEIVENVADVDLEKELRRMLFDATEESTSMEEATLQEIADTIRARRAAAKQATLELEAIVVLVFGAASLLLEEMTGSRLADLLQDDQADQILRGFWGSSFSSSREATNTPAAVFDDTSGSKDLVDNLTQAIVQLPDENSPETPQTDPVKEDHVNELHGKFRSVLKMLSLMQDEECLDNPLEDTGQVAFLCQLVGLPFPQQSKSDLSQAESRLDSLADKLVQGSLDRGNTSDIPDWLSNAIAGAAVTAS